MTLVSAASAVYQHLLLYMGSMHPNLDLTEIVLDRLAWSPGPNALDVFEIATDAGALDCDSTEDGYEISCSTDELHQVTEMIEVKVKIPITAQLSWRPSNLIPLDKEKALKVLGMIDVLDDHDDVQEVFANFDLPEEIFNEMS